MADRPLGLNDLLRFAVRHSQGRILPYEEPEHWVWCRAHEQARKNTAKCVNLACSQCPHPAGSHRGSVCDDCQAGLLFDCITIAPFTSEREANRLNGEGKGLALRHSRPSLDVPLGMEIEND